MIFMELANIGIHIPLSATLDVYKSDAQLTSGMSCEVRGRYGSYAYVVVGTKSGGADGFVKYTKLKKEISSFLNLSSKDINVWGDGTIDQSKKLTTSYKGEVEWLVGDDTIVDFNKSTGQITGLKPGVTTITAKADGMSKTCTVHSLYKWPQAWITKTNQDTSIYRADGTEYKASKALLKGKTFIVHGDNATDDGWAYGNIEGTDNWGYIPISHISTKGTISQYNNATTVINEGTSKKKEVSWFWPVRDIKNGAVQTRKARYITSPYGWRDIDPAQHRGIDITNGISSNSDLANSVDGYEVVSAFAGKVIFVHDNSTGYKSCGNCVAIQSNEKDPITGKYYVAIYMHLKSKPLVGENQKISANALLGYVGNTGNSGGSHLHFEVNNQNLSYGQKIYYENDSNKEMVFGSVINPLFFYMNYYNLPENDSGKIKIDPTCDAMDYRKPLWYGDDIKESKKP